MEGFIYYRSPLGSMVIEGAIDQITSLKFVNGKLPDFSTEDPFLEDCRDQLDAYFKGKLKKFNIKGAFSGTAFQVDVWTEILKVPYGKTISYKDIALNLDCVGAERAIGAAVGKNPIALVVPCHRIVGSNGELRGYAGGIDRKKKLLELENPEVFGNQPSLFDKDKEAEPTWKTKIH